MFTSLLSCTTLAAPTVLRKSCENTFIFISLDIFPVISYIYIVLLPWPPSSRVTEHRKDRREILRWHSFCFGCRQGALMSERPCFFNVLHKQVFLSASDHSFGSPLSTVCTARRFPSNHNKPHLRVVIFCPLDISSEFSYIISA